MLFSHPLRAADALQLAAAVEYDARDRLLTAGATSYTWDQNGNQLSAGARTFVYDLANRLKSTTLAPTTTTYTYDGDSIRTQASTGTTNQSKTNFTWDVNHALPEVVREASGSDSLYRRYIYGLDAVWFTTTGTTNAYHFHTDPLGSVRAVTAQGGATQWTYDYEPFGKTRTSTGSTPPNFVKFTGEYEDPTGLYHLRARQYDPATGRFLRPEPLRFAAGSGTVSPYLYSDCRPTFFVDPSGNLRGRPSEASEEAARIATAAATLASSPGMLAISPTRATRCWSSSAIQRSASASGSPGASHPSAWPTSSALAARSGHFSRPSASKKRFEKKWQWASFRVKTRTRG